MMWRNLQGLLALGEEVEEEEKKKRVHLPASLAQQALKSHTSLSHPACADPGCQLQGSCPVETSMPSTGFVQAHPNTMGSRERQHGTILQGLLAIRVQGAL